MTRKIIRFMMAYTFNKTVAIFWVLTLCVVLTIHTGGKVLDHYWINKKQEQTTNEIN